MFPIASGRTFVREHIDGGVGIRLAVTGAVDFVHNLRAKASTVVD